MINFLTKYQDLIKNKSPTTKKNKPNTQPPTQKAKTTQKKYFHQRRIKHTRHILASET